MKNLMFLIASIVTVLITVFAAYIKIMYGDSSGMNVAFIAALLLSLVSILDVLAFRKKEDDDKGFWALTFLFFHGWAQIVFYSKKLLHKK